jgi:hypothetical protein
MTSGSVMMFAKIHGTPAQPMRPPATSVPMATGISAKITAVRLRKWNQHHQRDGRERIPRRLHIAVLEQRLVFQQLHRRAGDVRIHGAQIRDEFSCGARCQTSSFG